MAVTLKGSFLGVDDVRRDLESVRLGLGKELTAALRESAGIVARTAAKNTPRGPGPQSAKDNLPHIADTITGGVTLNALTVGSTHPAAPVLEFGGTISPRGHPISFKAHEMAQRAGQQDLELVAGDAESRIDALLRAHGL